MSNRRHLRPGQSHRVSPSSTGQVVGLDHGCTELDGGVAPLVFMAVTYAGLDLEIVFTVDQARHLATLLIEEAIASEQCPDYLEMRNR